MRKKTLKRLTMVMSLVFILTNVFSPAPALASDFTPPTWPVEAFLVDSEVTSNSITVSWPAATDNIGVTRYKVTREGYLPEYVEGLSYPVTGLEPGQSFTIRVEAEDAAGNLSAPLEESFYTTGSDAPRWPTGASLTPTDMTSTGLTLNWPEAICGIERYVESYKVLMDDQTPASTSGSALSYPVTGLTPGGTYSFEVWAEDSWGDTTTSLTLTVTTPAGGSQTSAGQLSVSPMEGIAGQPASITLSYQSGEMLTGGTVVFQLPAGITPAATDTWSLGGFNPAPVGSGAVSGQTVTITGISSSVDPVVLNLINKTLPQAGSYAFSAAADADGPSSGKTPSPGTGNEQKTFTVLADSQTSAGTFYLAPDTGSPGAAVPEISLVYVLDESFTSGTLTFQLPAGFTATTSDKYRIGGESLYFLGTGASAISGNGQTVTISGISGASGSEVMVSLLNKTLPSQAAGYGFSVSADADGTGPKTSGSASAAFQVSQSYLPPAEVSAHNQNSGQTSGYQFQVPITRRLTTGDKIVITFPEAYRSRLDGVSLTRSTPDPQNPYASYAPFNADINGYNSGTVTISNVSGSGIAVTVTISGTTGEYDYLTFDLSGIVNPPEGDYPIQIRTVRGETTRENISDPHPVEIRQAGSYSLTVALKKEDGTSISAAGAKIGIAGMGLPPTFGDTDASGVYTFSSLSMGSYSIWAEVSPSGYIPAGPPTPVWVEGNQSVVITLRSTTVVSGVKNVTVSVSGLPSGEKAEIYASSAVDYVSKKVSGTGSPLTEEFYLQRGETYYFGVNPVINNWKTQQPAFMPPPPQSWYIPRVQEEAQFPIPGNTVSFNLVSAASNIDVTVQDHSGNPVPNASVFAYAPLTGSAGGSGYTDAAGRCRIGVTAGSYTVGVVVPGYPAVPDQTVSVSPGETRSLTFRAISQGLTISGKVLDAGGNGIARASVWANSANGRDHSEATSDNNGNYTLRVKDGTWTVGGHASGYGQIPEINVTMGGINQTNQHLRVLGLITVAGTVTLGGAPVPNAQVWAVESLKRGGNSTVTDSSGSYSLKLYNGAGYSYTVYCWIPGYGEKSQGGISSSRSDLHFAADPAYLKVIFSGDGSQKFSGYVAAYNGQNHSGQDFSDVSYVTLKVAPDQAYSVEAQIKGAGRKTMSSIPVSQSNTAANPATADFSGSLAQVVNYTVTVRDAGGGNLRDAFVSVFAQDGNIAGSGLTRADGTISFRIPGGSVIKYSAKKDGYTPFVSDPATVSAANSSAAVSLQSSQNLLVTGNVAAPGNIASVFVWATGSDGGWVGGSFTNDADDQSVAYAVYLPKAGSWVVSARADGYDISGSDASRTVGGAATLNLSLSPIANYKSGTKKETVGASGGAVDNREVGVKLIIPTGSLGLNQGDTASVTTRKTTSIPETGTARTVGAGTEINVADSNGKPITTLSNKIEITLDYSPYASQLTPEQIDALQLAYWDSLAKDWVIIPSVNDKINKKLVGYTDHLTKFAAVYPESLVLRGMQAPSPAAPSPASTNTGVANSGGASWAVSEAALSAALEAAGKAGRITLQAPDSGVALTPNQISKMVAAAKPVQVSISGITFEFNPAVLQAPGLNLGNVGNIYLGARKVAPDDAGKVAAKASNGTLYSLAGDVFELTAWAVMDNKSDQAIKTFGGTVSVALPVPDRYREAAAAGRLAACRFNDQTGAWEEVPGKYDGGVYLFETDRFSFWALMEKKEKIFSDISGHWARKDIEFMAVNGYISGMGGGLFAPDQAVTRAQFTTMLVNVLRLNAGPEVPFADVQPGQWFYSSVGRAYAARLVMGTGGGRFSPEDLITREQMSAMICNALKFKGVLAEVAAVEDVLGRFADRHSISGWARKSAAQAVSHGILKGRALDGSLVFAPGERATRAEAAVMLKNFIGQIK